MHAWIFILDSLSTRRLMVSDCSRGLVSVRTLPESTVGKPAGSMPIFSAMSMPSDSGICMCHICNLSKRKLIYIYILFIYIYIYI